jgi:hypothetical protein
MLIVKIDGIDRALRLFDEKVVNKAAKFAINDTAKKARTTADTSLRQKWNIKKEDIKDKLVLTKKANEADLTAIVQAKGRPLGLSYFNIVAYKGRSKRTAKGVQTLKRASRQGGVFVQILKGKPKTHLPSAFVKRVGSGRGSIGNLRVFERMGKARLPIADRHVITVASMFGARAVQRATEETVDDTFNNRFNHHIDRLMSK